MAVNKLALIRYKTIDHCLQNHYRKWTLDDLILACSDALYEYEGIRRGISKRAIQLDIQNMRSNKLGYSAPIVVLEKKYYAYERKDYSITNIPLSNQDMDTLNQVVGVLKQFKGFSYFDDLAGMVTKLEDQLFRQQNKGASYIDFEKNERLKGLEHIDPIHKAIMREMVLRVNYKSFKARNESDIIFHAYMLKEYRNRWFMLGKNQKNNSLLNLALDRIVKLEELPNEQYLAPDFDVSTYYDDAIGVSKMPNQKPYTIVMQIVKEHEQYIITKPMHSSQQIIRQDRDGTVFSIEVVWNFELEREILGYGEILQVLSPSRMVGHIRRRHQVALKAYEQNK